MTYEKVIQKQPGDLIWPFAGTPYFNVEKISDKYERHVEVDPFPCAVHNMETVCEHVARIESVFPTNELIQWIILPNETTNRTNGWAMKESIWSNDKEIEKKHKVECLIVLSGKRPIVHPSMTNYLVAHEYGHAVDYWITACMREETGAKSSSQPFHEEYAKMRDVELKTEYGGGRWVDNIMEIIADDFRIIVSKTDQHFYPHSCTHPLKHGLIINYWDQMLEKYSIKPDADTCS